MSGNRPDGSQYTGEVLDGVRHGQGTFVKEEVRYDGDWCHGKREGKVHPWDAASVRQREEVHGR